MGGRFNVGTMCNHHSFKEVKVIFFKMQRTTALRAQVLPARPRRGQRSSLSHPPSRPTPTPPGCLPELGEGAPWLLRGPALRGLRWGGVPLTRGSKHHHYLLVRHASGAGDAVLSSLRGEGSAGWTTGAGSSPEPRARTGGSGSPERSGSATPGLPPPRPGLTPPPQPVSRTLAPTHVTPSPQPGWETLRITRAFAFAAESTTEGGGHNPTKEADPCPQPHSCAGKAPPPTPGRPA